jgi:hypothetical protein
VYVCCVYMYMYMNMSTWIHIHVYLYLSWRVFHFLRFQCVCLFTLCVLGCVCSHQWNPRNTYWFPWFSNLLLLTGVCVLLCAMLTSPRYTARRCDLLAVGVLSRRSEIGEPPARRWGGREHCRQRWKLRLAQGRLWWSPGVCASAAQPKKTGHR